MSETIAVDRFIEAEAILASRNAGGLGTYWLLTAVGRSDSEILSQDQDVSRFYHSGLGRNLVVFPGSWGNYLAAWKEIGIEFRQPPENESWHLPDTFTTPHVSAFLGGREVVMFGDLDILERGLYVLYGASPPVDLEAMATALPHLLLSRLEPIGTTPEACA